MAPEEYETGGEQPVREQLKKATLESTTGMTDVSTHSTSSEEKVISKKRSFDDIQEAEQNGAAAATTLKQHTRKRSRDSKADIEETGMTKKRASDELIRDGVVTANGTSRAATPEMHTEEKEPNTEPLASPKTKRTRLEALGLEKGPAMSTTEDKSATAALDASLEPPSDSAAADIAQGASAKAFAASGFSALSKASSGFGAIGKTTGGFGFGGSFATGAAGKAAAAASPVVEEQKDAAAVTSVFGGALGARSAFSTPSNGISNGSGSGFSKLGGGSGFGSTNSSAFGSLASGPKLSSFASGKPSAGLNLAKPAKAFGTPANDEDTAEDDGEEADESGIKSPLSVGTDEDKKDERFYEQELETGEEDESVVFSGRAKLYTFTPDDTGRKAWKERGLGVLKLNVKKDSFGDELQSSENDSADGNTTASTKFPQARFLMRADGSHRVVLNTPLTREIKVAGPPPLGGPPPGGHLLFFGTLDGSNKLESLQLKMKPALAMELYEKVLEMQQ